MIPPAVLERGERAFVAVLRRRFPDAAFLPRDREGAIRPEDPDVAGDAAAGAAVDFDAGDESGEHVAALSDREATPKRRQGTAGRKPRKAGR